MTLKVPSSYVDVISKTTLKKVPKDVAPEYRLIAHLMRIDPLDDILEGVKAICREETKGAMKNSVALLPVLGDGDILYQKGSPNDRDHLIGGYNYNTFYSTRSGSETLFVKLMRDLSKEKPYFPHSSGDHFHCVEDWKSAGVDTVLLLTDYCGSGMQAISSVQRLMQSEFVCHQVCSGQLKIKVVTFAATERARTAFSEQFRSCRTGISLRFAREAHSISSSIFSRSVAKSLAKWIFLNCSDQKARANKRGAGTKDFWHSLGTVADVGKFLADNPELAARWGFGYGGVCSFYGNTQTMPNNCPTIVRRDCRQGGVAIFSKDCDWSRSLVPAEESYSDDPVLRKYLLGNGLTKQTSGESIFDYSSVSVELECFELLGRGYSLKGVSQILNVSEDVVGQYESRWRERGLLGTRGFSLSGRVLHKSAMADIAALNGLPMGRQEGLSRGIRRQYRDFQKYGVTF